MSSTPLTPSATAARIWKLLRGVFGSELPVAIDLEVVRELLNQPAFGKGANLKKPIAFDAENFEGALVRNEDQHEEWGIFYKPRPKSPERERFTIAHEMGHFVLHRGQQRKFNCDKESVYSGIDTIRAIEREADDFASNLLMPGDLLRDWIAKQRIDFRVLGDIAQRFQVSLEALCIRYIKFTTERAILVYWDNGYMKYEWRSSSAVKTRARIRRNGEPVEPMPGTLAADASIAQKWDGTEMSAAIWCPEEAPHMRLRELKHTFAGRDRVLTLLLLESAEPRSWDRSWQDEDTEDCADRFASRGQFPVR